MHRWIPVALAASTIIAYAQVTRNQFITLDDSVYITKNPYVLQGLTVESVRWAWTTLLGCLYQPLTWMSLQLSAQMFGEQAWGYHLTNLFFHTANVLLVYFVLVKMTKCEYRSAAVAALFALHPMHVESVAWATERKDVLVTFFWLLMIAAYYWYVQRPGWQRYLLVLLAFVAGLLSKAMIVTAPALLLLLDVWPLQRMIRAGESSREWRRRLFGLVIEKIPLLLIALVGSYVTMWAVGMQHPVLEFQVYTLEQRLTWALLAYGWYLKTSLLPFNLAVVYPFQIMDVRLGLIVGAALVLLTAGLWWIGRRNAAVIIGWLWFVGTLFPVAAFAHVGTVAWADRYVYFPHIGFFIMAVWGIAAWRPWQSLSFRTQALAAGVVLLVLGFLTWKQVFYWRNTETLFAHCLQAAPLENALAQSSLAVYYVEQKDFDLAELHCAAACRLQPKVASSRLLYAKVLIERQEYTVAIAQLQEADPLREPEKAERQFLLGWALMGLGRFGEAQEWLAKSLKSWPGNPDLQTRSNVERSKAKALQFLGSIRLRQGEPAKAVAHLQESVTFVPDLAATRLLLGIGYGRLSRWQDAAAQFRQAVALQPDQAMCLGYQAFALARQGKQDQAFARYGELLRRFPNWPADLRTACMQSLTRKTFFDRYSALEYALQICAATEYRDSAALDALAAAEAANGDFAAARETAARALRHTNDAEQIQQIKGRLELYEQCRPIPVEED